VLINRGIKNINHYLNTSDADILDPATISNVEAGVKMLIKHIANGDKIFLQIDSDADGYTSAAALINYLNALFPGYTQNNIFYRVHDGKQHGLLLDTIPADVKLVIAPDSSSNDYEVHEALHQKGIDVLVIDHHEADRVSEYACVINNQLCDYPTKSLSGVGMVYKFCSYIDQILNIDSADNFLDLVALGLIADVMLMKDYETKHLINRGLENIINPYFRGMTIKNEFSLGGNITPFGVAFYIAPYINAVTRCGTQEEKILLFESMLDFKAYELIPSTKRGFKGTYETRVEQACRMCANVKNRQGKSRDASLANIEQIIKEQKLLNNQILVICIDSQHAIDKGLTGLVATKIANEYQKPTLILNETYDDNNKLIWAGSGRIFSQSNFNTFKEFLEYSNLFIFAQGHQGAFGCAIEDSNIQPFIEYSNQELASFDFSPKYYIDLEYSAKYLTADDIFSIANFDGLWGQGIEEPFILIKDVVLTKDNIQLLKGTTLKITIVADGQEIALIKFGSCQEEYDALCRSTGAITINVIGHFQKNIWNNIIKPQIMIEDYEIAQTTFYYF
jgi:single-stranded-DNA-specific exonuclease